MQLEEYEGFYFLNLLNSAIFYVGNMSFSLNYIIHHLFPSVDVIAPSLEVENEMSDTRHSLKKQTKCVCVYTYIYIYTHKKYIHFLYILSYNLVLFSHLGIYNLFDFYCYVDFFST